MSELISFLYSEEQGYFHHDPPESNGDSRYRLVAKNVMDSKCCAFEDLLIFKENRDIKLTFYGVKNLWTIFNSKPDLTNEQWFDISEILTKIRTFYIEHDVYVPE